MGGAADVVIVLGEREGVGDGDPLDTPGVQGLDETGEQQAFVPQLVPRARRWSRDSAAATLRSPLIAGPRPGAGQDGESGNIGAGVHGGRRDARVTQKLAGLDKTPSRCDHPHRCGVAQPVGRPRPGDPRPAHGIPDHGRDRCRLDRNVGASMDKKTFRWPVPTGRAVPR